MVLPPRAANVYPTQLNLPRVYNTPVDPVIFTSLDPVIFSWITQLHYVLCIGLKIRLARCVFTSVDSVILSLVDRVIFG